MFPSVFYGLLKIENVTAASPANNPSDMNFSKIASFLPNLGNGFPVYTDKFQTNSESNYSILGNGTLSISTGSATVNGSAFIMASKSAPFEVCNLCAKTTVTSYLGTGQFGIHIYKDPSNYVALEYNPGTYTWSLIQNVSGSAWTVMSTISAVSCPFTMALVLQGKNAVGYYTTDGKNWNQVCDDNLEHNIFWDMRFAVTQYAWRSGFVSSMTSLTITSFTAFYSNGLTYRDERPITYATGQPVLFQNCLYYTVDLGGNGIRETVQGVVSWNLTSNQLYIISMLYYNRTDKGTGKEGIFCDGAGNIFFDQDTKTWHDFFVTWGSNDLDSKLMLYQAILPFNPLTPQNVQIIQDSSQVTLSTVTNNSTYDPVVYKIGSEWYLYFIDTNGNAGWSSVYPHLTESSDLNSWTNVYLNISCSGREGCGFFFMGNTPYLSTSNGMYYNATTGIPLGSFSFWDNSTSYNPWTIPVDINGKYYLFTFTSDIQYSIWYGYGVGLLETYSDPGVTGHLSISAPSSAVAGTILGPITVTAYDSYGNVMTGYNASISFGSSDQYATLPFTYSNPFAFTTYYNGTRVFTNAFEFFTSGTQTITVSDGTYTVESAEITVYPNTLDHFIISSPKSTTAGTSFDSVIVTACDSNDNIDTAYNGSVYFTSSDSQALLPYSSTDQYRFAADDNGQHNFSGFILKTAGPNTISTVDSATGVSASVIMSTNTAGFDHLTISPSSATITAGAQQKYAFATYDAYGNTLGSFNESASWSISSAAGGSWVQSTGTYLSQYAGQWVATCTCSGKNATSSLTVNPGIFDHFNCTISPTTATAGSTITGTATAFDSLNNSLGTVTASWAAEPEAGGSWLGNLYNSQHVGTWNITATYSGRTDSTLLRVNPGAIDYLIIAPSTASIKGFYSITYNATAYDSQNNTLGLVDASWSTPASASGSWNNSTYTAEYGGQWTVTAEFSGKTATSTLDVTSYTINAISDAHSLIYPAGVNFVVYNSSQAVSYLAKNNYMLTTLVVDGNQKSLNTYTNDYSFNNILTNHTIQIMSQLQAPATPTSTPNQIVDDQTPKGTLTESPTPAAPEFPPIATAPIFLATAAAITIIFFKRQKKK